MGGAVSRNCRRLPAWSWAVEVELLPCITAYTIQDLAVGATCTAGPWSWDDFLLRCILDISDDIDLSLSISTSSTRLEISDSWQRLNLRLTIHLHRKLPSPIEMSLLAQESYKSCARRLFRRQHTPPGAHRPNLIHPRRLAGFYIGARPSFEGSLPG